MSDFSHDQQQHYEHQPLLLRRSSLYTPNFEPSSKTRTSSIESDSSTSSAMSSPGSATLLLPTHPFASEPKHGSVKNLITGRRRRIRRRRSLRYNLLPSQIKMLRLFWFLSILIGEYGAFWMMVHRCSWPENSTWDDSSSALQDRYRIAIVADPQLTDWFSYKQSGLALWLTEFYTDLFMRRSFAKLHQRLRPDAVLYLGDLMDGGRETMDREVFDRNRDRFLERVFDSSRTAWNELPLVIDAEDLHDQEGIETDSETKVLQKGWFENGRRSSGGPYVNSGIRRLKQEDDSYDEEPITGHFEQILDVPLSAAERSEIRASGRSVRLYVAGNHEVGFGDTLIRKAMKRYKSEFGSVNYEIQVGNHTLVVLDTLALSSNITSLREESQAFLSKIEREPPTTPRILFTHVPLFRLETTFCGDARESKQLIMNRNGEQYQNMVNASLSREILRKVQPDMVFSGDDHDWCEIAHSLDGRLTPEVTLPTFSFAQGIQQPGFVLLSLYNPKKISRNVAPMVPNSNTSFRPRAADAWGPGALGGVATVSDNATFSYEECLLPRQMSIYHGYVMLFGVTLAWLLIRQFLWLKRYRHSDPVLIRWRQGTSLVVTATGCSSKNMPYPLEIEKVPLLSHGSTTTRQLSPTKGQWQQISNQKEHHQPPHRYVLAQATSPLDDIDEKDLPQSSVESMKPPSPLSYLGTMRQGTLSTWNQHCVWPLLTPLFWEKVLWDLWAIFRYVVPFYLLLVFVSVL